MCLAMEEEQKEVWRFFPNLFPGGLPPLYQSTFVFTGFSWQEYWCCLPFPPYWKRP